MLCVQNNVSADAALGQAACTTHEAHGKRGGCPSPPGSAGDREQVEDTAEPSHHRSEGTQPSHCRASTLGGGGGRGWAPTCKTDHGTGSHRFHRNTL